MSWYKKYVGMYSIKIKGQTNYNPRNIRTCGQTICNIIIFN